VTRLKDEMSRGKTKTDKRPLSAVQTPQPNAQSPFASQFQAQSQSQLSQQAAQTLEIDDRANKAIVRSSIKSKMTVISAEVYALNDHPISVSCVVCSWIGSYFTVYLYILR
jgi:hypothetical protein